MALAGAGRLANVITSKRNMTDTVRGDLHGDKT